MTFSTKRSPKLEFMPTIQDRAIYVSGGTAESYELLLPLQRTSVWFLVPAPPAQGDTTHSLGFRSPLPSHAHAHKQTQMYTHN